MGRALFSTMYNTPQVTVRTEPDVPDQADFPRCEKWSISNPFDPDSDEFYDNATREVFTDTEEWQNEQDAVREQLADQAQGGAESPAFTEASESDAGSPMAVGSDDPALLIADAYTISGLDTNWTPQSPTDGPDNYRSMLVTRRRRSSTISVGFVPPISPTMELEASAPPPLSPPQSPVLRRSHAIIPISLPDEPSSSPASPATPTGDLYHREIMSMLTPSPVPTVTPHIYTWRHTTPLVVPDSPLSTMGGSGGPLTNPNARMSLARLNVAPVRILAQNAAV